MRKENNSLSEFTSEEGFELQGYISHLFEQADSDDNKAEANQ